MKKTLLLGIAWLALTASIASAGGLKLAWNDCLGAGGASNRTFACDTNVGNNDLYVSFEPPSDVPDVNGLHVLLDLFDRSAPVLPGWWQFKNIGSCRLNAMSAQTIAGSCASIWGQPSPATAAIAAYLVTAVSPSLETNHARLLTSTSVPTPDAAPVHPAIEYAAQVVRINNTKTTGLGACGGCQDQLCIAVTEIVLFTSGSGEIHLQNPGPIACPGNAGTSVSWQGSNTPTLNRTWGQLKSLYR